jgi:hypothetical protein
MKTKIKSVTVISQPGVNQYEVGQVVNGLKIVKIQDYSCSLPDQYIPEFQGFSEDNNVVFQVINAPVDVQYEPDVEEEAKRTCLHKNWNVQNQSKCPDCGEDIPF